MPSRITAKIPFAEHKPFLILVDNLCVTDSQPVTIDKVSPVGSQGIDMLGWGLRKFEPGLSNSHAGPGADFGRLADLTGYTHTLPVGVPCHDAKYVIHLIVNIAATSSPAVAPAFAVDYGDGAHQLLVPYAVTLCARHCSPDN